MGCAKAHFCPAPWGPGEVPKGQILLNIFKFQLKSQFQRLLNQTLCFYSQMKDIKHLRRDFHSAAWVISQGWDLGVPWGLVGSTKFFQKFQPKLVCELLTRMAHATAQFCWVPPPCGFGERPKGHISLSISITMSILKIFKPNFVCLLTNERYKTYQTGFSLDHLGHAHGVGLGIMWGLGSIFFLN